jgi:uncharacterized protein
MASRPATFRPVPAFEGPHAQTLLGVAARPRRRPETRRIRYETPDGDFLDVDRLVASEDAPHLLILHGLEGSSRSGYVNVLLEGARARGWGAFALNFRGCSGEPNRLPRAYHAGATGDVAFVVERIRRRCRGPLFAAGVSLGGNVLLRHLAEAGADAELTAAAVVGVPYDLAACALALDGGAGMQVAYRRWFLRTLKAKALQSARRHPGCIDVARVRTAAGIASFDDAVTAPLNGFAGVEDYYTRCASGPALKEIRRPVLLLAAEDDPLVPAATLPREVAEESPYLDLVTSPRGGHVGFIGGSLRRPSYWAEATMLSYLGRRAADYQSP